MAEAKIAIKDGADINGMATAWNQMSGTDGYRILHVAAEQGHLPIVELLVRLGADRSVQTVGGHTPLDLARENSHEEIVKYIGDSSS